MSVVVQVHVPDGNNIVWGPFTNAEQACSWAHRNLKDKDWGWYPMERPGSTYMTCDLDDVRDFIEQAHTKGEHSYVTIDGVNWAVIEGDL